MKFKLLVYNILNSCCAESPPYVFEKKRLDMIAKVIEEQKPDVLALCEGFSWSFAQQTSLKDMKKVLSTLVPQIPAEYVFRWAPVVLTSHKVIKYDPSQAKKKLNLVQTTLEIGKKKVFFDVYHPHPGIPEDEKAVFIQEIIKKKTTPYIIAGDFNAISSQDEYNREELIEGFKSFMNNEAKAKVDDLLKFSTINTFLRDNLIDTYRFIHKDTDFTMPTDLRSTNKKSAIRIDYIFCSKDIKVIDAGIVKTPLTEKASDHYPIYAVLEIK